MQVQSSNVKKVQRSVGSLDTGLTSKMLTAQFCKDHKLGDEKSKNTEVRVTLINESGKEYKMKLSKNRRIVNGWSNFSNDSKLIVGDVLVFKQIGPASFEVHIVRREDNARREGTNGVCYKETDYTLNGSFVDYKSDSDTADSDNSFSEEADPSYNPISSRMVVSGHPRMSGRSGRNKRKRANTILLEADNEVMTRAKNIQGKLPVGSHSFVKDIKQTYHDLGYFRLPSEFCNDHLMDEEATEFTVTLVDEKGDEYGVKFVKQQKNLSTGWRNFAKANNLSKGDVLVFHQIDRFKFKVYIARRKESAADVQLLYNQCTTQLDNADKQPMENIPEESTQIVASGSSQTENSDEGVVRLSHAANDFAEVKSFDDFVICINGMNLDSELSEDVRRRYYDLCLLQNSYLHDKLLKKINFKSAANKIIDIVNITEAIQACKISTSSADYERWEIMLRSYESVGMEVGFILDRLKELRSLAFQPEWFDALRWQVNAERELSESEEAVKILEQLIKDAEAKLLDAKERIKATCTEMEKKKGINNEYESKFLEKARAPW